LGSEYGNVMQNSKILPRVPSFLEKLLEVILSTYTRLNGGPLLLTGLVLGIFTSNLIILDSFRIGVKVGKTPC
jgi:hypothetical protein